MQALSMARGLSLRSLESSSKVADLEVQVEEKEKRIRELEVERDLVRIELRKARDQIGEIKDEAEEAKLELIQVRKGVEDQLSRARAQAVEEFKGSEEQKTLLGEYGSGSYHYGLRLARSFLRTKLPDDVKPVIDDLKSVNELANELELSASETEDNVDEEVEDNAAVNADDLD
jgi:chromosome segregation ATPase